MYCAREPREMRTGFRLKKEKKKKRPLGRLGHRFNYDNIFLMSTEAFLLFQQFLTDSQKTN
jgi:hypothetical protein